MALVIAPFHRHKLACRGICQEIFSPPAPAGAEIFGWPVSRGSQKRSPLAKLPPLRSETPFRSSSSAPYSEQPSPNSRGSTALANLRASFEMHKTPGKSMTEALSQSPVPKANFTEQQICNQRLGDSSRLRDFVVKPDLESTTEIRRREESISILHESIGSTDGVWAMVTLK